MERLMLALATGVTLTWEGFLHQLRQVWFLLTILGISVLFLARSYSSVTAVPKQVEVNTSRITSDSLRLVTAKLELEAEMKSIRSSHDSLFTTVSELSDLTWKLYCYEVLRDGTRAQQLECNIRAGKKK